MPAPPLDPDVLWVYGVSVALLKYRDRFALPALAASPRATESLVEALQRGDARAIGAVYDEHHERIRAFARRLTGDESAAEDVVHEVFVSLPRAIARFRGESSLATFLLAIAVNHARHHVRAAARRRHAINRFSREPGARGVNPEEATALGQLAASLQRALDALPYDQRITIVLCEVEERSAAEVAAVLGIPEATVRTRNFHARRKLRDLLAAEGVR